MYNVLRIVSGKKRFSLYNSPIDFAAFIDVSVMRFTKLSFLKDVYLKISNRSFIHFIVAYPVN